MLNADLGKLGLWNGFSLTVHAEYNFGQSVNGRGGTIAPVNTALYFPGIKGADRADLSSVYFGQRFGDSVSLLFGKINIIDIAASQALRGRCRHRLVLEYRLHRPAQRHGPALPLWRSC